ncbi:MAG: hypothetical protein WC748_07330 [Legionellales bacterium]|jgi:hypothetical protein
MLKEDCKAWVEELAQSLEQVLNTFPVQENIANANLVTNKWFSIKKTDSTNAQDVREKLQRLHEKLKEFAILLSDSKEVEASIQEGCYSYIQGAVENIENHVKQFLKNNMQGTQIPIADILILNENIKNFIKAYDHAFFINQEKFFDNSADYFKEILADLEKTYSNNPNTRVKGSSYAIAFDHVQKYIKFSQLLATKKTAKTEIERVRAAESLNKALFHHNNYKEHQIRDKYEVMHNTVENTIKQYVYIYKRIKKMSIQRADIMIKFFNAHSELCLEGSTELADWAARIMLLDDAGSIVDIITDPRNGVENIIKFIREYSDGKSDEKHKLFAVYKKIEEFVTARSISESQKIAAAKTSKEQVAIICAEIPEKVMFEKKSHNVNEAACSIVTAYMVSIHLIDDDAAQSYFKLLLSNA